MNTKTIDEQNITDEELELIQNSDPASDPMDAAVTGAAFTGIDGKETTTTTEAEAPDRPGASQPPVPADQYEKVKAERDQFFERMARMQAEFDNARKRETRERADFREFATAGAVEQFLPVIDNFQLALKAGGTAEQLRAGVELIVKQMDDVLRSLNVQPVEAVGAHFDPHVHESIGSAERVDLPDQQVLEEVRRGYKIKDRLLRPALVRVVANPNQKEI